MTPDEAEDRVKTFLRTKGFDTYCLCISLNQTLSIYENLPLSDLSLLINLLQKKLDKSINNSIYD